MEFLDIDVFPRSCKAVLILLLLLHLFGVKESYLSLRLIDARLLYDEGLFDKEPPPLRPCTLLHMEDSSFFLGERSS